MKYLLIFILIAFANLALCQSAYELNIIVNSIEDDFISADFKYAIQTDNLIKDKLQYFHLPFNNSTNLQISTSGESNNQLLTYGFNESSRGGYCVFSSSEKNNILNLYVKNVILPVQNSPLNKNNVKISLLFDSKAIQITQPKESLLFVQASQIFVHSKQIVLSDPVYQSTEDKGKFKIGKFENNRQEKIVYLELPAKQTNYIILTILLIGALLIGLFGAPRIIKKKEHSRLSLGISILALIGVVFFWFKMIYQSEHEFNFDIVSIIGGVVGLLIGIIYSSWKNLIELKAIDDKTD